MTATLAPPLVSLTDVHKSFSGASKRSAPRQALRGFDLTVAEGEFFCLLGPSGCGKSTLMNLVAGFLEPDVGEILVAGERVTGPGSDRGVLFQTPALFPWMTTLQNVMYGPRAAHAPKAESLDAAHHLLETVGLGDAKDSYPHELSGGMRHRAAFARVLINKPRLLLMDEPFGALDSITRAAMQDFLLELWQRGRTTIIFVTHDVEEAVLLADRICVMSPDPEAEQGLYFDVDLPRPRDHSITETLEFVTLKRKVRQSLEAITHT